jgi:large subunit ribosomal protein L9
MSGTPMKLILTQEVTGLGAPGDVVEVAPGYGRNYLVPRGLAMLWTRGAQKQIELIRRARSAREIRSLDDAKVAAAKLAGLTVRLQNRAGGGGRLFGAVSTADIVAAVKEAGGPALDKRKIEVKNPIKTVGAHQVAVRLHPEISATLSIEVSGA